MRRWSRSSLVRPSRRAPSTRGGQPGGGSRRGEVDQRARRARDGHAVDRLAVDRRQLTVDVCDDRRRSVARHVSRAGASTQSSRGAAAASGPSRRRREPCSARPRRSGRAGPTVEEAALDSATKLAISTRRRAPAARTAQLTCRIVAASDVVVMAGTQPDGCHIERGDRLLRERTERRSLCALTQTGPPAASAAVAAWS